MRDELKQLGNFGLKGEGLFGGHERMVNREKGETASLSAPGSGGVAFDLKTAYFGESAAGDFTLSATDWGPAVPKVWCFKILFVTFRMLEKVGAFRSPRFLRVRNGFRKGL